MQHNISILQAFAVRRLVLVFVISAIVWGVAQTTAMAYPQYSVNRDATYCRACHGDFRAANYTSLVDGMNWGNLHNLHRTTMLNGDCEVCHQSNRFPVSLDQSLGGLGLAPISCVGCHGRAEDNAPHNPDYPNGYGAGLRQHHYTNGVVVCLDCHTDSNPTNYTAVGENVLPTYYANPGSGHPAMPTESCNGNGSENFAGAPIGLDNDGDNVYDMNDSQCNPSGIEEPTGLLLGGGAVLRSYPNPAVGTMTIEYEVPGSSGGELRIFDVSGRLVRHLASVNPASGPQRVQWDGRNDVGKVVPSGVYVCEYRSRDARFSMAVRLLR